MDVIMPKLGLTMTHGTIVEWLKQPGERVEAEESLCVYDTEKVTLDLPSPVAGVMGEILAAAGEMVPAGAVVCEVVTADEILPTAVTASSNLMAEPIKATPLARRIATEAKLDLRGVRGSGVDGMITREDVEALLAAAGVPPDFRPPHLGGAVDVNEREPRSDAAQPPEVVRTDQTGETVVSLSSLRRTIAERMTHSAFTAPHVTLTTEAEATNLVSARSQLNAELPEDKHISYNSLLAALVAAALREHPAVNARWEADGIHLIPRINIALAVDTHRGLLTPVLPDVDLSALPAIQSGYATLIARAIAGKSLPDDFAGGTFTITNLGGHDVDAFTPIINPPQAAILGVGRILEKPVARDGAVVIRPMVALSLSFDHRIINGGPAARFLQRVKQLVERPAALLLRR